MPSIPVAVADSSSGRDSSAADASFAVGTRVQHAEWGEGAVQRYDGDQMTVLFDSAVDKAPSVELVLANDLRVLSG